MQNGLVVSFNERLRDKCLKKPEPFAPEVAELIAVKRVINAVFAKKMLVK